MHDCSSNRIRLVSLLRVLRLSRSQEDAHCQTMTLGKASVFTFACPGAESAAPDKVIFDVLVLQVVHSPTNNWQL